MYWIYNLFKWYNADEQFKGKPLCCEYATKYFIDSYSKWHNKFPKEHILTIPEIELKIYII